MNKFIHKTCEIEDSVIIGKSTRIWNYTHVRSAAVIGENCNIGQCVFIDTEVKIGNFVKIQNNVSVYKGVTLEDGVFCGPSCVFTNVLNPRSYYPKNREEYMETRVCEGATIGANSTIICGNNIGRYSFIGAGAVVTKDVKDYSIVIGNPAKHVAWVCECGEKLVFFKKKACCNHCKKAYVLDKNKVKCLS